MPKTRLLSLTLPVALTVLSAGAMRAQNVDISATAVGPLSSWYVPMIGAMQTFSHPAGALPAMGSVGGSGFGGAAFLDWNETSTPASETFALHMLASSIFPYTGAGYDPFTMVLDVSSPTPRAIEIDLERIYAGFGTSPQPTVAIDIGNDGTIEYPDLPVGQVFTVPGLLAGPTPLQIRISVSAVVTGVGSQSTTDLAVRVRPDNACTFVQTTTGCLPGQPGMEEPEPVFADHGVDLHFSPGLLVASTVAAPTMWGPSSPLPFATQCLLYPQPDILLWEPGGHVHIALPAALRPQAFHVQAVFLAPVGIVASDAYQVTAN